MHPPTDLPRWVYLPAIAGIVFVAMPLVAIAIRVDWPRFWALITTPSSQTALLLSVKTAAASTVLCVLLGVRWRWCWPAAADDWCGRYDR